MPAREAANALGISVTTLKTLCRDLLGFDRWPSRTIQSVGLWHLHWQCRCAWSWRLLELCVDSSIARAVHLF